MTHDQMWLATMRQLYGEDYVKKLLEKNDQDEEADDDKNTSDFPLES